MQMLPPGIIGWKDIAVESSSQRVHGLVGTDLPRRPRRAPTRVIITELDTSKRRSILRAVPCRETCQCDLCHVVRTANPISGVTGQIDLISSFRFADTRCVIAIRL